MSQDIAFLIEKANSLPLSPGVYIMRDEAGKVIYVGKSRSIKNRVSQYFRNKGKHNIKTDMMVSKVRDFDYILTDTENEALTLESQLIKQYDPKYNIKLKDGKNAPYIKVDINSDYPSMKVVYERKNDGARYFGPYYNATSAYAVLRTVQKCFRLPQCKKEFPHDIGKERPCLYYQMGLCIGVCSGNVSSPECKDVYRQVVMFLRGSFSEVKRVLTEKMERMSDNMLYEAAALYRDRITALSNVWEKHKIVASPDTEHDIIALYSDDEVSCVAVFFIREGRIISSEDFMFMPDELTEQADLAGFVYDFYSKRGELPSEILLSFEMEEEKESLEEALSSLSGHRVRLRTPERGEAKQLCNMALENASRHALQYKTVSSQNSEVMIKLAMALSLEVVPDRIESYDISNYGKEQVTAGMVVAKNGKFSKADYRLFKMKTLEGKQDDYASMKEAVIRRFERAKNGDEAFSELPDLILLDGGKGHVSVVRQTLAELGMDIPVFGMVKDEHHKTRTLCDDVSEISIAKEKQLYMFVFRLQEEVHRFTISKMRSAKNKTLITSSLEQINGIGSEKAKKLLNAFDSLDAIKNADEKTLSGVKGISPKDAKAIKEYFGGDKK